MVEKRLDKFTSEEIPQPRKIAITWSSYYNRHPRLICLMATIALLSFGMASILQLSPPSSGFKRSTQLWGYLAPYHATDYKEAPANCIVDQVNIVRQRSTYFLLYWAHFSYTDMVLDFPRSMTKKLLWKRLQSTRLQGRFSHLSYSSLWTTLTISGQILLSS